MWQLFAVSLMTSALVCAAVIVWARHRPSAFLDSAQGPQKFHSTPTPRVGGVAIFSGYVLAVIVYASQARSGMLPALLGCGLVVFAVGLAEDVTKRVSVSLRLAAAMLSGGLAFYLVDARLERLDVWFLDVLLHWKLASLLFTAFAVAGIANAINIIDGYNGLSGGYSLLALAAIAIVGGKVGDVQIVIAAVLLAGSILGFLLWNFPGGRIFMGDAGAYFVGFVIAELSLLLVQRHASVSPWFPLLVVAYPVWETLFSIYRKRFVRGTSPGQPDGLHFHMLVYKRVVRWKMHAASPSDKVLRNAMTSPYLWALAALPISGAMLLWDSSLAAAVFAFAFGAFYNLAYRAMATFKVPGWMVVRSATAVSVAMSEDEEDSPAQAY